MYIFKIIEVIDRSKAWYKGEVFGNNTFENVTVTNPIGYEAAGVMMGETKESAGFLYTSLIDYNSDDPEYNYVGYPSEQTSWSGKNTWLRSGYANRTKMLTPESGGITESFGAGMSGTLSIPSGSIPNGMYNDANACTCCLFYGVLGASITINWQTIENLDSNEWRSGYGDPELTDLTKAITVSTLATHSFGWSISLPATNALSTYCTGCYLGSWSYIGRTQWTDHKKSVNDYSRQEQDERGNYSLSKKRTGRTYSAEVILTTRKDAVLGDYDYDITSLCASVVQLLRTCLGTPMAFYFNNQDIGCPWIPHNVPLDEGTPVLLNNSDIIVGILQNCEITDIQGNRAVLKMSVNSVPNEYQNYNDVSGITPSIAPPLPESIAIPIPMCTDVVFANMITEDELSNGDSIALELTTQEWTNVISLTPTPSDAPIKILSVEAYSYTQITIGWVPDPSGYSDYIFTVTFEGKGDPAFEWENVPLEGSEGRIIRMRGLTSGIGDKKNFLKIQTARWDTTSNTYGYGEMFYLDNVGTTVTSG